MTSVHWRWLALSGVIVVAAGVRCWRLDTPVLTHDEAFSWRLTQYPPGELCMRTGLDVHPPLYYLALQGWDGVFGDSVWAMRGLSVLLGVAAVLMAYAVGAEVLHQLGSAQAEPAVVPTGALLAALLAALSTGQVDAARNARMYSLGVLLAALSAWLLLRALRAGGDRWYWWAAYGLAAALFCYTHNYAFFTLFGQGLFVAAVLFGSMARRSQKPTTDDTDGKRTTNLASDPCYPRHPWWMLCGMGYAALLAFILYWPWLPVLLEQMRQVKENYWMAQPDAQIVEKTLFTWATGFPYEGATTARLWLGLVALAIVWATWRRPRAALFFVAPALCPMALSIALSLATGRSIFHDHLFVFAQFSLIGFWGVVWAALPGWPERCAVAVVLIGMAASALAANVENWPGDGPGIVTGASFLKANAAPGDELWTGSPWELNQWRYYLLRAGADDVKVRCRHSFPGKGHMIHIASVSAEEVIWTDAERAPMPRRVWITGSQRAPRAGMRQVLSRDFGRQGNRSWSLTLHLYEIP